jgi:LemA protein
MKGAMIALVVIVVFAAVALSGVVLRDYNQLAIERSDIEARWIQLQRDMKARADTILTIVPKNEEATIAELGKARVVLLGAQSRQEIITANSEISAQLETLERRHPNLTNDQALQDAQQKLANDGTDYNKAIERYNTDVQLFPNNVIATTSGFSRYDAYFRTVPR